MASMKRNILACHPRASMGGTPGFSSHALDSSNDAVAFLFQAVNANPITHVGIRYQSRTGTPPTYVATLETVDLSTGNPSGTDVGGGSPTAVTFTPPADNTWNGTWQWFALTNAYTPTRGQLLFFTIRYSSGTIDASNNSSPSTNLTNMEPVILGAPGTYREVVGTWTKQSSAPIFGIRTASERYGAIYNGLYNTRTAATIGHRAALKFKLPDGAGSSFKVAGLYCMASIAAVVAKAPIVGLWNAAGSAIQTVTIDADLETSAVTSRSQFWLFDEASLTALDFNTDYYIGFEVAETTNSGIILSGAQLDHADDRGAYTGGTDFCLSLWDGSSWTDDTTVRPFVDLVLDDWTGSAGGGGVSRRIAKMIGA